MNALPAAPWMFAFALGLIAAEALWRVRSGRGYDAKAAAASFGVAAINGLIKPLSGAAMGAAFMAVWAVAPVRWPVDDWRAWAVAFILVEFVYYWFHRWSHTIRWLWASHSAHHSASQFALPSAIRLGWTNFISGGWLLFAPLVAAGFHPGMIAALLGLNLVYQFWLHTEAVGGLGPVEWIFNTPSHHRAHHACDPEYLDTNFGGVLIVWDRLFGTFAAERKGAQLRYGLVHAVRSHNPFVVALHEWRNIYADLRHARSARGAWSALFGRPR